MIGSSCNETPIPDYPSQVDVRHRYRMTCAGPKFGHSQSYFSDIEQAFIVRDIYLGNHPEIEYVSIEDLVENRRY